MTFQKTKGKVLFNTAAIGKELKMSNTLKNLEQDLAIAKGRVTKLQTAIEAIRDLEGLPAVSRTKASPAGARKSIFHPNATDIAVLDTMLSFSASEETPQLQMDWISKQSGIEKAEVQRGIKWLKSANLIDTIGRGRGTHYTVLTDSNNLSVVDESSLGDNYRKPGAFTVKQYVRAIFNGLEPAQKVSPAKILGIAQQLFPESNLTRQSFGQVFTKMSQAGELQFEGEGRSRQYWRGMELLEDVADVPEDFDFGQFFSSDETSFEQVEEDNAVESDSEENSDDSDFDSSLDSEDDSEVAV